MWSGNVASCQNFIFKSPDEVGSCQQKHWQDSYASDQNWIWSISYTNFQYTNGANTNASLFCSYQKTGRVTGTAQAPYAGGCGAASALMRCGDGSVPNTAKPLSQQCADSCVPPLVGFQPNCKCPDGASPVDGKCADCASNKNKPFNGYVKGVTSQPSVCQGGCNYNISSGELKYTAKVGGEPVVIGTWVSDGSKCTTATENLGIHDDGDTSKESAYSCAKKGMTSGEVNGATVCIKPTKDNTLGIDFGLSYASITNKLGDAATTALKDVTEKVTLIKDGSGVDKVQVETSERDLNGTNLTSTTADIRGFCQQRPSHALCVSPSGVGSDSPNNKSEKSQMDDFCAKNPQSPMCINGTWSDQGCNQGTPSCQGDAVQCAQAKLQWQQYCALAGGDGTAAAIGNGIANGSDPLGADLPTPQNATQLDISTQLKTSDAFLSSGCLQDVMVPFNGGTIKIPWSDYCVYFEYMGYITMAVAGLISLRIIGLWS